ncbi:MULTISPECIES: VTT domain-containing protein [unclassified Ketobacter]|uniref:VTT domain-containing protein n=1 Tax=unclassified Ketobacter TaxID=2639109 RepID=UPI000F156D4F|nr:MULTISPECIES: VTT domain-containing protein [unclassified Ketobacter]RLT88379.1 MAG: phospholipase [Ketobacter sp. GenoA1]RLT95546.1 MAG: phospholipase [Ketobacter sp.]
MKPSDLFSEDSNCWRHSLATYMCPLIDCANYYRTLYHAIVAARKSIFIAGWDIDSRIDLLRGDEANAVEAPVNICELLAWKARQNPDLRIYLLRWDSSLAFFSNREIWAKEVWEEQCPDNVQVCLDDTIPMGGSQHQKIVVIDDELAFNGGMDIAWCRWDTRKHEFNDPRRNDTEGPYGPIHDVQVMVAGPVVLEFAKLLRWRWKLAANACDKAISAPQTSRELPASWPHFCKPLARNIPCAIARTIPFMDAVEPAQEVRHMLLDLIHAAEEFIYIENQFASREEIAEALNQQLKRKPQLKVLVVSSYEPKGTMECEAYWAGRIDFKNIVENGVRPDRIRITHSSAQPGSGDAALKRIHSKLMTIDDRYLVIGSSNFSNRSMTLDTECDLIFAADSEPQRAAIAHLRNDLLAEHTSLSIAQVERILQQAQCIDGLLQAKSNNQYHLSEVNDHKFTDQTWQDVLAPISDPEEPLVPPLPLPDGSHLNLPNPRKKTLVIGSVLMLFVLLAGVVLAANHYISWFNSENLSAFLEQARGTSMALPTVLILYVVGGLFFFPVTVMSLAVAAVFGPIWGPIYGMSGALTSAAVMFWGGEKLGDRGLRKLGGHKVQKVDEAFSKSGVIGVATIRLLPIAPYSLVNLVAGISSIKLLPFLLGTFLGMLPPMIAKGLVGDSLSDLATNPSTRSITYLAIGILIWVGVIVLSRHFARKLQSRDVKA